MFTASGSEACATALLGIGRAGSLVTSAIEHPCVLLAAERRETPVVQVRPGPDGRVEADAFDAALAGGATLCALQAANNETGVVQPADEVALLARARGVTSFVDAVQAPGRLSPVFEADVVAYSAHKFGGPAGVGILAVRRGVQLEVLVPGHQEGGRRGGTPPVVLCEAAALALEFAEGDRATEGPRMAALRDRFERSLCEARPRLRVHGAEARRLGNTSNVCFPGVDAETVLIALDLRGVRGVGWRGVRVGDDAPLPRAGGDGRSAGRRPRVDPHLAWSGDDRRRRDRPAQDPRAGALGSRSLRTPLA